MSGKVISRKRSANGTPGLRLEIIQQPIRARYSQFSIKSRDLRPIMHPPILQLLGCDVRDADSYSSYICFVSLWSNNLKEDCSISSKSGAPFEYKQLEKNASSGFSAHDTVTPIDDHNTTSEPLHSTSHLSSQDTYSVNITEEYQRSFVLLSGASATAAHAQRLKTIDGKYGVFFVFYDLSVRMRGEFRLKFELFDMRPDLRKKSVSPISQVTSDSFQVIRAEDWPGAVEPSELSQTLMNQIRMNMY